MKEQWKPVRGFENYAEISNYGQIHYFERVWYTGKNHQTKRIQDEHWTYGSENSKGYLNVCIGRVVKGVHVWLYETFYDCDVPKGYDVNHLDENKHNNRLDNLNLLSHGDNIRYGTGIARHTATQSEAVQALNPKTLEVVMEFPSTREAERQFGFSHQNISKCCRGEYKTAYGYIWRFKE